MKMKHRYPIGTILRFKLKVTALPQEIFIDGTVVYHGSNEQGFSGIGIELKRDALAAKRLDGQLHMIIKDRFGTYWGEQIAGFLNHELS